MPLNRPAIQQLEKSIFIQASPALIWRYLTEPAFMNRWMAEPEVQMKISTSWQPGSAYLVSGFHHGPFENKGEVLRFEPPLVLSYSHLSSISHLPDVPESYTIFTFTLTHEEQGTLLVLHLQNFPTESIFKHLEFYWGPTLSILKGLIEDPEAALK